jgi:hypothetical protein
MILQPDLHRMARVNTRRPVRGEVDSNATGDAIATGATLVGCDHVEPGRGRDGAQHLRHPF